MLKAVKAVGFDLWETLITNSPELSVRQKDLRVSRTEQILVASGFAGDTTRIERAYHDQWQRCHELYWSEDRDISCRRQVEHFLEELDLDPHAFPSDSFDQLEHAYANVVVDVPPEIVAGAPEVLRELKARGLRLGLISNTGRSPGSALRRVLESAGLAAYIDVMVFSNEHGACKPHRSIFEELRGGLSAEFEEMAFVGDNLYVDILGAQRLGMRAIHFDPPRRGTAIAPPVEHPEVTPDARVRRLEEVLPLIESWR